MKILVLLGGDSNEREVSLRSGRNVADSLIRLGHEVVELDPAYGLDAIAELSGRVDAVFPILHGTNGEDGKIQKFLEDNGFNYLGANSEVSKLCFDKNKYKEMVRSLGILTADWDVVNSKNVAESQIYSSKHVLKPIEGGSSIDTLIIRDPDNKPDDYFDVLNKYGEMIIEELIEGVEVTVPVVGDTALPVVEVIPPENQEFDYENKYNGETQELCPPQNATHDQQVELQRLATEIHEKLGVRHLSRSDFIITADGKIYNLELNTIPGMSNQSLLPVTANVAGLGFDGLVQKFVDLTTKDPS